MANEKWKMDQKKRRRAAPPRLPAAALTFVFSRILKLHIQYGGISRKFSKKILEQDLRLFQNKGG